jgi:hypothetical protein
MLQLLLNYLHSSCCLPPGGDALTLDDALHCYMLAADRGAVPALPELLRLHTDFKSELESCFGKGE